MGVTTQPLPAVAQPTLPPHLTPWAILWFAWHQHGVEIDRVDRIGLGQRGQPDKAHQLKLRITQPAPPAVVTPGIMAGIRGAVVAAKSDLLDILEPGSPLAWLWGLLRSPSLDDLGSVRSPGGEWWDIARTAKRAGEMLLVWSSATTGGTVAARLHAAVGAAGPGSAWRSPGFESMDLWWPEGRGDSFSAHGSAVALATSVGRRPPGSRLIVRGPEFPSDYVLSKAIPSAATEYRVELAGGGKGDWRPIPPEWMG